MRFRTGLALHLIYDAAAAGDAIDLLFGHFISADGRG
jgi:hypothetical protein